MIAHDHLGVSTWSLRHLLGTTYPHDLTTSTVGRVEETFGEGVESLLDLPSALANRGHHRLDLVSLHLPSRDRLYLGELRAQLSSQKIVLETLLIEAGDLSHPLNGARDADWIAGWFDVAGALGAQSVRVIAGRQPPTRDALDRAANELKQLVASLAGSSLRVLIQNGFDLLASPVDVLDVLGRLDGSVGLLADFGQRGHAGGPDGLAPILARAERCHLPVNFTDGAPDLENVTGHLGRAEAAGYAGPVTLVVDSGGSDEWAALEIARDFVVSR